MRRGFLLLSLAAALGFAATAAADPITVSFTGYATVIEDPDALLDGSVGVATPYSGSFSYDPDLLVDSNLDPDMSSYDIDPLSFSFSLEIGSYTITFDPGASVGVLFVDNDLPIILEDQHGFSVSFPTGFESLPTPLTDSSFSLNLSDTTGTAVGSDALVGVPYVDSAWTSGNIQLGASVEPEGGSTLSVYIEGTLSFVPEPASALLLAPLALLAARRRG